LPIKFLISIIIFLVSSAVCAKEERAPLIIGSKNFSESIILGEIVSLLLEEKFSLSVNRKLGLGGTKVAFDALRQGGIDIYPEYTGTGYVMILGKNSEREPKKVHEIVSREFKKKFDIVWSEPLGFNNTYALAVRKNDNRFKSKNKISQVAGYTDNLSIALTHEFMERQDGYREFSRHYNIKFEPKNIRVIDSGLMYSAIRDGEVDMVMSYSTDGRILAYDLKILEDDRNYFPPYHVALVAKKETLKKNPEVAQIFKLLKGRISEAAMVQMNDSVDRRKEDPQSVARKFLVSNGFLAKSKTSSGGEENIVGFVLRKKGYLMQILLEHLYLSFSALLFALIISIPTGILLSRYESLGRIVFPIINTIQTIPSLALLGFLIPLLGIGFAPAVIALFLYSLLPLIRNTYTGIIGVDKDCIEASRGIGLTNQQILFRVELPLALPVILAGVRTAAVIVIGTATLAALVGAGGLGDPIFRGLATINSRLILLGAVPAAILAVITDRLISLLELILVSKGIR